MRVFADRRLQAPVIDDFIRAADIARGTFYGHFKSTVELLDATIKWLGDETIAAIEAAMKGIHDPALRVGTGVRLWLRKSQADVAWCRFVSRIWDYGELVKSQPMADIQNGLRTKVFRLACAEAGWDLVVGTTHQAMLRYLEHTAPRNYAETVAATVLRGLGVKPIDIETIIRFPLPEMRPSDPHCASPSRSTRRFGARGIGTKGAKRRR